MTATLLPCPFCGEAEELYPSHRWPGGGKPYGIDCLGCGIEFEPREGMDVVEAWNRRPSRRGISPPLLYIAAALGGVCLAVCINMIGA